VKRIICTEKRKKTTCRELNTGNGNKDKKNQNRLKMLKRGGGRERLWCTEKDLQKFRLLLGVCDREKEPTAQRTQGGRPKTIPLGLVKGKFCSDLVTGIKRSNSWKSPEGKEKQTPLVGVLQQRNRARVRACAKQREKRETCGFQAKSYMTWGSSD